MIKKIIILIVTILSLGGYYGDISAQVQISGILDIAETQGDKPNLYDTNIRGDNPFHPIRSKLFLTSWMSDHVAVFIELWHDDDAITSSGGDIRMEGAFIAFMNLRSEALNIKVGKFAVPFGTYYNRAYSNKNPLIGAPLLYGYHTVASNGTLYKNNAEQLERKVGIGQNRQYGVSFVYEACWSTGIALFANMVKYEYLLAITNETVGSMRAKTNDGKQIAGRFGFRPTFGLKVGMSAAYGPYLYSLATVYSDSPPLPAVTSIEDYKQKIYGFDLEYSRGHLEIFGEYARNSLDSMIKEGELAASTLYLEGKYKLTPRLYAAIRYDQMIFDKIDDGTGTGHRETWDYDVIRVEGGFGYKVTKDVILKLVQRGYRFNGNHYLDEDTTALQMAIMF